MNIIIYIVIFLAGGFGGYLLNDAIDHRPDVNISIASATAKAEAKTITGNVNVNGSRSSGSIIITESALDNNFTMTIIDQDMTNYYTNLEGVPADYRDKIIGALELVPELPIGKLTNE